MAEPRQEQRTNRRFSLKLPVELSTGTKVMAETRDVSARGVFFYVDSEVSEGSPIEFTITLPPEITLTESIRVKCTGRVVRVDQSSSNPQVGIAAAIEQYDFEGQ